MQPWNRYLRVMAFKKTPTPNVSLPSTRKGGNRRVAGMDGHAIKGGTSSQLNDPGASKKKGLIRNALTGRFMSSAHAVSHPGTTVLLERPSRRAIADAEASSQTKPVRARASSTGQSKTWTTTDEVVITRLAKAAEQSQRDDGQDVTGLSDDDLRKALFG